MIYIGLGGAVGSVLRYTVAGWIQRDWTTFPVGTLAVNLSGCLLMGFLAERLVEGTVHPPLRLAVLVGVLGGFTTFSTFSWETWKLLESGQFGLALVNILASVLTCLAGTLAGVRLARSLVMP